MGRIREERAFWAHQLHATLLNSIGAAIVQSQVCEEAIKYGSPHSLNEISRLKDILADLEGAARTLAAGAAGHVRPNLANDIHRAIETFHKHHPDTAVSLSFPQTQEHVSSRVARATLVVLTEALSNALRHASPTRVEVDLTVERGSVLLRVRDDGQGFDIRQVSEVGKSDQWPRRCGLEIMHEFAEALGGKLAVSSVPGRGTQVTFHVPLETNSPSISSGSRSSATEARTANLPP